MRGDVMVGKRPPGYNMPQLPEPETDALILGEGYYVSKDDRVTGVNANVCIVGAPGTGKTRSIVVPNILNAKNQSVIVSDPKGRLYREWGAVLKKEGRLVWVVDFTDVLNQSTKYNPFAYIRTIQDTMKFAHVLAYHQDSVCKSDPFWDLCAESMLSALVAYLKFHCTERLQTLHNLSTLLSMASHDVSQKSQVDKIFDEIREEDPDAFCVRQWDKTRTAPIKTYQSILVTASAKLACLDTPEIIHLTGGENMLDFKTMVDRPAVLFVTVSDTDRSMDNIASILMFQAYSELVYMADHLYEGGRLDRHVTLILDDYASSIRIPDLDKILSASRSRNISSMVILQNEGQLKDDADVIIGSCDNYVYLGSGDATTCKNVALKADIDTFSVMNQKIHRSIVFRRGTDPVVNQKNFELTNHPKLCELSGGKRKQESKKTLKEFFR